jgi:hypothetical protein
MASTQINLNSASVHELCMHYNIGNLSAKRMIRYREANGNKLSATDLEKIPSLRASVVTKVKKANSNSKTKLTKSKFKPQIHGRAAKLKVSIPSSELKDEENVELSFKNNSLLSIYGTPLKNVKFNKNISRSSEGLRFKIPLSKYTPPGSYQIDIQAGNTTFQSTIDVVETIKLSTSTSRLLLDAKDKSVDKEIVLTNNGNVPLDIKSPGGVMLEVEHIDCRVIRGVVSNIRKGGTKSKSDLDVVLDLASKELESLYKEAGVMRVKLKGNSYTLAPGEAKKLTFTFTIPATLKDRSYNGALHFYDTSVLVNVAN